MSGEAERRPVARPLLAFGGLLTILAFTHTMWRDEVRAWSVATKTASWAEMIAALHEEGHPLLWYALLRIGHAITGSQYVMPLIAALIGLATAWIILRFAPLSWPVRLLAVFGAFLGYELTIVARNYGIGVLLILSACALAHQREERPWLPAIVLVLLANTSVHGSVAAAVLAAVWLADVARTRDGTLILRTIIMLVFVAAAIAFALATARPLPEMAYAFSWGNLTPSAVLDAIMIDPGHGLRGTGGASLVASGELPWGRIGLDEEIVSRVLVNVAVLAVVWGLRKNLLHLAALVVTVFSFEILFRLVYPGALRHQGLVAFLIFGICWLAVVMSRPEDRRDAARRISLGLIPLLALQAIALPFTALRAVIHPESMAADFARQLKSDPRLAGAVLMSEPEPLMETLPYYAPNPVFFPRQREFDYRAWFDRGTKRRKVMSLADLMNIADSVACSSRQPVLISVGYRPFHFVDQGGGVAPYGATFTWSPAEKREFNERTRPLPWLPGTTGDENYRTYELILPECN